ncbi:MAG: hypothetical protein ACOYB8_11120 [Eubacteriaceae bacterium]|jgi:uncharacterized protein (DUF697 family)
MTETQRTKCSTIIHIAAAGAGGIGAGLAQLPMSDTAVITPMQIGMAMALAEIFDLKLDKSAAASAVGAATTATIGRTASQLLVGWIPGLGNAVNAGTAFSLTEALGWTLAHQFDRQSQDQ